MTKPPQALELENFLPYRLSVLAQLVSESLHDLYVGPFELTVTQWRVMAALGRFAPLTASDVGQRIVMDKGVNADRVNRTGAIPLAAGFYTESAFYNHQLDFHQLIAASLAAGRITADPRFNLASAYQTPIQARFGVKFTF